MLLLKPQFQTSNYSLKSLMCSFSKFSYQGLRRFTNSKLLCIWLDLHVHIVYFSRIAYPGCQRTTCIKQGFWPPSEAQK